MSDKKLNFLVKEISVSGSFKNWGEQSRVNMAGVSGGSEIMITVIPDDSEQRGWTAEQAQIVSLDVRMRIQVILMADAQKRGVTLPTEAKQALVRYREEVTRLKEGSGSCSWRDKDIPSPEPSLVKKDPNLSDEGLLNGSSEV